MTSWSPAAPLITSTPQSDAPEAASAIQGGTPRAVRLSLPGGPPVDAFALAGESGILLAASDRVLVGLGRSLTLDLPRGLANDADVDAAMSRLSALPCDDVLGGSSAGHAVLAFGALPFLRTSPASLVVPELTYCREGDGREWVTLVSPDGTGLPDPSDPAAGAALRTRILALTDQRVTAPPAVQRPVTEAKSSDADFVQSVAAAVDAIRRGALVKVVLARAVEVFLAQDIDVPDLIARWAELEPSCTIFALPTDAGRFVGASPELLVERSGAHVRSRPLAGTIGRIHDGDGGLPSALLESAKDGEEHRLVVDAIRAELAPLCTELQVPERPELVHLHTITHLGTTIDGTLRSDSDGTASTALHLVARLHPTPAVCGVPRLAATDLISRLEPEPRGAYAGPVGYVDASGDGRWMVGIRALTVTGRSATMTAGVGIVAESDPSTELSETSLKFRAVFEALAPGSVFEPGQPAA